MAKVLQSEWRSAQTDTNISCPSQLFNMQPNRCLRLADCLNAMLMRELILRRKSRIWLAASGSSLSVFAPDGGSSFSTVSYHFGFKLSMVVLLSFLLFVSDIKALLHELDINKIFFSVAPTHGQDELFVCLMFKKLNLSKYYKSKLYPLQNNK